MASYWFARRIDGPLAAREEAAFNDWIAAAPAHAVAYSECEQGWDWLGEFSDSPEMAAYRAAAQQAGERRMLDRRRFLNYGGTALAATLLGAIVVREFNRPAWAKYSTGAGERLTKPLGPGSELTLAPLSRIDVELAGQPTRAKLAAGEAFFRVLAGAAPLRVDAPGCTISGRDCSFQVALLAGKAEVIAIDGDVIVNAVPLKGGHRWYADRVEPIDALAASAWRTGRLAFQDEPLSDVTAAFNRYSTDRFTIADPALADLRISGSFRFDRVEEFPQALEEVFALKVDRVGPHQWRITPGA